MAILESHCDSPRAANGAAAQRNIKAGMRAKVLAKKAEKAEKKAEKKEKAYRVRLDKWEEREKKKAEKMAEKMGVKKAKEAKLRAKLHQKLTKKIEKKMIKERRKARYQERRDELYFKKNPHELADILHDLTDEEDEAGVKKVEETAEQRTVRTPYGSGVVELEREDGGVNVALKTWTLSRGQTVRVYVPVMGGGGVEVDTPFGKGRVVAQRADGGADVVLSWTLSRGQLVRAYLPGWQPPAEGSVLARAASPGLGLGLGGLDKMGLGIFSRLSAKASAARSNVCGKGYVCRVSRAGIRICNGTYKVKVSKGTGKVRCVNRYTGTRIQAQTLEGERVWVVSKGKVLLYFCKNRSSTPPKGPWCCAAGVEPVPKVYFARQDGAEVRTPTARPGAGGFMSLFGASPNSASSSPTSTAASSRSSTPAPASSGMENILDAGMDEAMSAIAAASAARSRLDFVLNTSGMASSAGRDADVDALGADARQAKPLPNDELKKVIMRGVLLRMYRGAQLQAWAVLREGVAEAGFRAQLQTLREQLEAAGDREAAQASAAAAQLSTEEALQQELEKARAMVASQAAAAVQVQQQHEAELAAANQRAEVTENMLAETMVELEQTKALLASLQGAEADSSSSTSTSTPSASASSLQPSESESDGRASPASPFGGARAEEKGVAR